MELSISPSKNCELLHKSGYTCSTPIVVDPHALSRTRAEHRTFYIACSNTGLPRQQIRSSHNSVAETASRSHSLNTAGTRGPTATTFCKSKSHCASAIFYSSQIRTHSPESTSFQTTIETRRQNKSSLLVLLEDTIVLLQLIYNPRLTTTVKFPRLAPFTSHDVMPYSLLCVYLSPLHVFIADNHFFTRGC